MGIFVIGNLQQKISVIELHISGTFDYREFWIGIPENLPKLSGKRSFL